jgi:hypothetical protein
MTACHGNSEDLSLLVYMTRSVAVTAVFNQNDNPIRVVRRKICSGWPLAGFFRMERGLYGKGALRLGISDISSDIRATRGSRAW